MKPKGKHLKVENTWRHRHPFPTTQKPTNQPASQPPNQPTNKENKENNENKGHKKTKKQTTNQPTTRNAISAPLARIPWGNSCNSCQFATPLDPCGCRSSVARRWTALLKTTILTASLWTLKHLVSVHIRVESCSDSDSLDSALKLIASKNLGNAELVKQQHTFSAFILSEDCMFGAVSLERVGKLPMGQRPQETNWRPLHHASD